jgi:selenide,water dikinase
MTKHRLTQFTKGGGCGCKIAPEQLSVILKDVKISADFGLVVGNSGNDDAAVIDISEEEYLISTTDFFTPIVDDPYDFGRIAAANALSDIYAMGGKPIMAMSILCWPTEVLGLEIATEVLKGASDICKEAKIGIGGGHSIQNTEPIFGLAVNGIIQKENLKRNDTSKIGDTLILTKPVGSGILSTALKRGLLDEEEEKQFITQLAQLNTFGYQLGKIPGVNAVTDITGFGVIGHLSEMIANKEQTASINYESIPLMDGVKQFALQMIYPDNTMKNWKAYNGLVSGIQGESLLTLCDPQTNGGLLISVEEKSIADVFREAEKMKQDLYIIGEIIPKRSHSIVIV